jgi:hypothetical protein
MNHESLYILISPDIAVRAGKDDSNFNNTLQKTEMGK